MHLLVLLVLLGGVPKGGKLYIKGDNVTMTAKPDGTGAKTALKAGDEVIWQGPSDKDKHMHAVDFRGQRGYVQMANLTPNPPPKEPVVSKEQGPCTFGVEDDEEPHTSDTVERLETSSTQAKQRVEKPVKEKSLQTPK